MIPDIPDAHEVLLIRALASHYRFGVPPVVHPDPSRCTVEHHKGLHYVVLRDPTGRLISAYRVLNSGGLRALHQPPRQIRAPLTAQAA